MKHGRKFSAALLASAVIAAGPAAAQGNPHVSSPGLIPPPPKYVPKPKNAPSPKPVEEQATDSVNEEPDDTPVPPSLEEGGNLHLMCFGGGAANKTDVTSAFGSSEYSGSFGGIYGSGSGSSTATVIGRRAQGFEDQVSLRMNMDEGRLRMPRTMLPTIRGGKDGWFKLKGIEIKSNEITASVAVSIMNNPKLRLDRYSGTISISGKAGDFTGQCRKFDPAKAKRRF